MFGMPDICHFRDCTAPAQEGVYVELGSLRPGKDDRLRFKACADHIERVRSDPSLPYFTTVEGKPHEGEASNSTT